MSGCMAREVKRGAEVPTGHHLVRRMQDKLGGIYNYADTILVCCGIERAELEGDTLN